MLLRSHGGGNCSGDGGAHEGGPDLHPTGLLTERAKHLGRLQSLKLYIFRMSS